MSSCRAKSISHGHEYSPCIMQFWRRPNIDMRIIGLLYVESQFCECYQKRYFSSNVTVTQRSHKNVKNWRETLRKLILGFVG